MNEVEWWLHSEQKRLQTGRNNQNVNAYNRRCGLMWLKARPEGMKQREAAPVSLLQTLAACQVGSMRAAGPSQ